MFQRMIPLAVAIVLVLGCDKKKDEVKGGPDPNTPIPGAGSDPGAAYTIKIRAEQAGDKTDEVETEVGTAEINFGGKGEKEKQDQKMEFAEHIIDMPAGAAKPTKLTRTYKVARKYDKKSDGMKALPYEGKTVTIEKKGATYEFTADGKKMNPVDASELVREFSKGDKGKIEDMLPKSAVKIGEAWNVEPAALKALGGEIPFPIDAAKSKITGKLTRAYTKDGKQWGVIALDCDLAVNAAAPDAKGDSTTGSIKMNGTIDTVIDGSSREGTMMLTIKMNILGKQAGGELKIAADLVATKTVKNAK